jgi:hypothetical protein
MSFRPQSTREWVVIGAGVAIVAGFLLYEFVIVAGQERLEKDRRSIIQYERRLAEMRASLSKLEVLEGEYDNLITQYSNHLGKIGDVKVPDDIEDELRREFEKIDRIYNSTIGRTRFAPMETNQMYSLLKYGLSSVLCDWRSLNAALYLIENSGQLVGFDQLVVTANDSDKRNVMANVQMGVKSFIFPERGTTPWTTPDYTKADEILGRDIFKLPEAMMPPAKQVASAPQLPAGQLPSRWRALKLTTIARFFGKPHAVFKNQADRSFIRVTEGEAISNPPPGVATILEINLDQEYVKFEENGQEHYVYLREYRLPTFAEAPRPFNLEEKLAAGPPLLGSTGIVKRSTAPALPRPPPAVARPATPAAPVLPEQRVEVPTTYEKPLGGYADCQLKTGMILLDVNQYIKRRYRLSEDKGMLVYKIQKLGAAEKSGVLRHDIIVAIAGQPVNNKEMFTYALNNAYKNGRAVNVTVVRNRQRKQVTMELN